MTGQLTAEPNLTLREAQRRIRDLLGKEAGIIRQSHQVAYYRCVAFVREKSPDGRGVVIQHIGNGRTPAQALEAAEKYAGAKLLRHLDLAA